jgi:hypothetical protein
MQTFAFGLARPKGDVRFAGPARTGWAGCSRSFGPNEIKE